MNIGIIGIGRKPLLVAANTVKIGRNMHYEFPPVLATEITIQSYKPEPILLQNTIVEKVIFEPKQMFEKIDRKQKTPYKKRNSYF